APHLANWSTCRRRPCAILSIGKSTALQRAAVVRRSPAAADARWTAVRAVDSEKELRMGTVRAVVVDPEAPGRLALREVELPTPGRAEALVRVAAISLNRGEVRGAMAAQA